MGNILISNNKILNINEESNKKFNIVAAETITVTFDPSDENLPVPPAKQVIVGGIYGVLPFISRPGFLFAGWTLNSTLITSSSIVLEVEDHTLIAQWIEVPVEATANYERTFETDFSYNLQLSLPVVVIEDYTRTFETDFSYNIGLQIEPDAVVEEESYERTLETDFSYNIGLQIEPDAVIEEENYERIFETDFSYNINLDVIQPVEIQENYQRTLETDFSYDIGLQIEPDAVTEEEDYERTFETDFSYSIELDPTEAVELEEDYERTFETDFSYNINLSVTQLLTFDNSSFGNITVSGGTSLTRTAEGSNGTVHVSINTSTGSGTLQRRIDNGTWFNVSNSSTFSINVGETLQFRAIAGGSGTWVGGVVLKRNNSSGVQIGSLGLGIQAQDTSS